MSKRHLWDPKMCFYCADLDMRQLKTGRPVYWCERRSRALTESFVWKECRHFRPAVPEAPAS
jgi:hypothetical protein